MKKNVIGMVFTILALVFITIGLVGVWYSSSVKATFFDTEIEANTSIYLTKIEGSAGTDTTPAETQSMSISDARARYEASGMDTSFIDAIETTFLITIIAMVLAIVSLVFAVFNVIQSKLQIIAGIMGILVFIFALIAPIFFMLGFNSYVEAQTQAYGSTGPEIGFWYSMSVGGTEMSMGPGYAWYLMIIAAVFGLIGGIMLFMKQKQAMPIPAVPMQSQTPPISPPIQ